MMMCMYKTNGDVVGMTYEDNTGQDGFIVTSVFTKNRARQTVYHLLLMR